MYDLIIIGGGWAGFNAAIRAKKLGLKTCLIEKAQIGGTCLNRGCIPTKSLIQSAKIYNLTRKSSDFGIDNTNPPALNFSKLQQRKEKIVRQLRQGMESMLGGTEIINSEAKFLSDSDILAANKAFQAKSFLIATGSYPSQLDDIKFDGKKVISSDQVLELKEIPRSLLIIGAGAIGCEFASLFSCLGTQVTIAEKMPQLIPGIDKDIAGKLEGIFKKRGIKVMTGIDSAALNLKDYDLVLLSIGRQPVIQGMELEKAGVKIENGRIAVDDYLRTSIPHIYAAGDCTREFMLAHFAAYQGRIAAENLADPSHLKKADNDCVPNCIFTQPEIASVGLSAEAALVKSIEINVHKFDFLGSGMARLLEETEGFIKIISGAKNNQILGASLIGPRATEIIGILTLAVTARLKISQLRNTIFAHPTISEAIGEALEEK
ncbi:MAG: dihydrolipoyl dehydrogenase [Candidatus Omnitrophica bacterium]|nr:dihydrolipoyl dehydrogenase [Candidatus Omnitrophota bacterium]